jgi:hypothetical protein
LKVVSNSYKEVMNQTVRPASKFQASLEMIDRSVESDATVVTSESMEYSTGIFDKVHECDYITFEKNFFKVGSDMRILPSSPSDILKNGYVSSVMCDENGNFQSIPTLEFEFSRMRDFIAMTYEFARAYPTQIRVTYYLKGEQVGQFVSTPDNVNFIDATNHIGECDRITFEFLSMSEPNRRLRIARLIFGYEKKFETGDILSTDHTLSIDPLSSSLPYEKISLKVNNMSKDYNPDNPQGTWAYFSNGQPLSIRYGITTNGVTEWVEAGRLLLSDAPTVDGETATFEAIDKLSTLTNSYYKGSWREEGISLYDLAIDVFEDADVTEYVLDESLKDIITRSPLPILPHRECLQLIANAGQCILYTNNIGVIVIEKQTLNDSPEDFYLDFAKLFNKPVVKKTEELKSVDVSMHTLYKESTQTELFKQEVVEIYGTKEIQVNYDMATDFEVVVEGGKVVSSTFYAHTAFLKISSESVADVIVLGYKIVNDTSVISTKVNNKGEPCPIDNPLVTDENRARRMGEWVATYLSSRNTYEANFRQDFALDVNDVILIKSEFEDNIPARVTKLQYKLPGQQGAISVRRMK